MTKRQKTREDHKSWIFSRMVKSISLWSYNDHYPKIGRVANHYAKKVFLGKTIITGLDPITIVFVDSDDIGETESLSL